MKTSKIIHIGSVRKNNYKFFIFFTWDAPNVTR